MASISRYQVQEGTPHRYGGKAYVKDGDIIEISGVKKEDEARFKVKLAVFLNAFAVHLVVVRHAGMGHLAIYQKYLMRLTTNKSDEYRDKWKQNKSAALLMKVLTPRRTSMVNYNIQLLIGPGNSLVGRATSCKSSFALHSYPLRFQLWTVLLISTHLNVHLQHTPSHQ